MSQPTDFVGRLIQIGHAIAYPVRRRSKMWLNKLHVNEIVETPTGTTLVGHNDKGRRVTIQNLDNTVVLDR